VAGVARIVIGVILVLLGFPFLLLFFSGIILIIIGIILIASGVSARGDEQRMVAQQNQTNALLQQQMQLNAMQMSRQQSAPAPPPSLSGPSRYCPYCGAPVAQGYSFCKSCGKAVPA
jgi:hypothetical protein